MPRSKSLPHTAEQKSGNPISTVKWDTSEVIPRINFNNGEHFLEWAAPATEPEIPADKPVKIRETDELFETISAAISAADSEGLDTFTLEISGDVTETTNIVIAAGKNITIVGVDGAHTVTSLKILVQGGNLTLGDGTEADLLTMGYVTVTSGTIDITDGILLAGYNALALSGSNSTGTISGGRLEGSDAALDISNGAQLIEISGGVFSGKVDAVHLSDAGTRIHLISGGVFYQTDETTTLHGHAVFVQNLSEIGEISGGYFDAVRGSALVLTRGGKVGEISGGEFVVHSVGAYNADPSLDTRNAAITIKNYENYDDSGIGTISGGNFKGTNFGILLLGHYSTSYINRITGGTIKGSVALQSDYGSIIDEISGGTIIGIQGILNVGIIKNITGQAYIQGLGATHSYGIYNYSGGTIQEISGGTIIGEYQCIANPGTINLISGGIIVSEKSAGISNSGAITLITGGKIIGYSYSIYCSDLTGKGTIGTISGGIFLGTNSTAIYLVSSLILEPNLSSEIGNGRYWGKNGVIFNNESLVTYPENNQLGISYYMSTETEATPGMDGAEFKYLRLPAPAENAVIVVDSYATVTGAGLYEQGATVTINAGSRNGYTFTGWVTSDGVMFANANSATTSFTMPDKDVTVTATWEKDITNPPKIDDNVPKTGDTDAIICASAMLATSLFALAGGTAFKLKKKQRRKSTN